MYLSYINEIISEYFKYKRSGVLSALSYNFFVNFFESENTKIDVVVCDPPRKGCAQEFLDAVAILKPRRFVYISCNVATQARDVAYIKEKGYKLIKVQPVDMFPMTNGVESVALLEYVG